MPMTPHMGRCDLVATLGGRSELALAGCAIAQTAEQVGLAEARKVGGNVPIHGL